MEYKKKKGTMTLVQEIKMDIFKIFPFNIFFIL